MGILLQVISMLHEWFLLEGRNSQFMVGKSWNSQQHRALGQQEFVSKTLTFCTAAQHVMELLWNGCPLAHQLTTLRHQGALKCGITAQGHFFFTFKPSVTLKYVQRSSPLKNTVPLIFDLFPALSTSRADVGAHLSRMQHNSPWEVTEGCEDCAHRNIL